LLRSIKLRAKGDTLLFKVIFQLGIVCENQVGAFGILFLESVDANYLQLLIEELLGIHEFLFLAAHVFVVRVHGADVDFPDGLLQFVNLTLQLQVLVL
jgi:hypothetical protein